MSRKLSIILMGALAILAVVAIAMWSTPNPVVSQTGSTLSETGNAPVYVMTRPLRTTTKPLSFDGAGSGKIIGADTMKAARGTGNARRYDTSEVIPTHLGPYGLIMPKITYMYQLAGAGTVDSVCGTLILQAAVNPLPATGGQWITIARLDSLYGATATVTAEKFRTITLNPPDTLASYGGARFIWDNVANPLGSTTPVYGGGDTTRIVICPLRVYTQTYQAGVMGYGHSTTLNSVTAH